VGKGVGDGCMVGEGVGVGVSVAGVGVTVGVGVGDDAIPPSSSLIPKVPSLTETGISLIEISFNVVTSSFKIVEVPGLPTAWKVTFAKIMSPLTPFVFHADIMTVPLVSSAFQSTTVDWGPSETSVT